MVYNIICAWCGRGLGVKYVGRSGSDAHQISHSICPECKKKVFRDIHARGDVAGIKISS